MDAKPRRNISSEDLNTAIATSMDGFLLVDMKGNILEVNDSYCRLVGYTREQLLNMHVSSVDAVDSQTDVERRLEMIVRKGSLRFETRHRHKNSTIIDVEASANYSHAYGGSFFSFVRDISYQKRDRQIIEARLRLIEYSHHHSLRELLRETLDEAEKLTGSCIGFYHFMDAATEMLTLQAWSTRTAAEFCKAQGAGSHYPVAQAGVWVDCVRERRPVIHNDYASLPHRKGMPDGHAEVIRELVVPIFRDDRIVAILGVGNKKSDYDQQDIEVITILADLAWEVAERKKAEDALKKSEAILRSSQHLAKVGGWKWDIAMQTMTWTEETYRIHDLQPGSIPPGSSEHIEISLNCYDTQDRQIVQNAFQRCIENGEEYDLELPFTTANGRRLWIRTTAKPVWHEDRVAKVIGNIMDITLLKQSEIQLRESKQLLEKTFDSLNESIFIVETGTRIVMDCNRTCETMFGYSREEMIGAHTSFLHISDEMSERFGREMKESYADKGYFETTFIMKRKDGTSFDSEHLVTPVFDENGEIIRHVCVVRNISERKKYEEKIKNLNRELESRVIERTSELERMNKELEGFCYAISHEFRAPIARMEAFGNMMIEIVGEKGDEQILYCAGRIIAASNRLRTVIDSLLMMNRLSRAEMTMLPVNLSEMSQQIAAELLEQSEVRSICVSIAPDIIVQGDRYMLEICMRNLLGNAFKYSSKTTDASIEFGKLNNEGVDTFFVRDNGVGFDMGYAKILFVPFCRLHSETEFEGTGVGLATVHRIIEKHGGRIWVEAEESKGATFFFTLDS